jgi:urate oxidase
MLRVVHRGDRHDPKDLTVCCRFEGDFGRAFRDGHAEGLVPGETLKNLVYASARQHGSGEIEPLALAICDRILGGYPRVTRVRVEVSEQPWGRLEVGGKAQGQAFVATAPERRTTAVTNNGKQVAVVSGIDQLTVMRTAGFGPRRPTEEDASGAQDGLQRLLIASVSASWTYSTPDVTFGAYRQGIRTAIVETFAAHASRSVQHTLYSIADVVLGSYEEISQITVAMHERPYRPADLFSAGMENPDDLFVAIEEPVGEVEVTVER